MHPALNASISCLKVFSLIPEYPTAREQGRVSQRLVDRIFRDFTWTKLMRQ
jgi:hypothetical protein